MRQRSHNTWSFGLPVLPNPWTCLGQTGDPRDYPHAICYGVSGQLPRLWHLRRIAAVRDAAASGEYRRNLHRALRPIRFRRRGLRSPSWRCQASRLEMGLKGG